MVPRIFRGDDTDANGRTVEIQLPDEDMAGFRMRFEFLGRAFEFDELPRGGSVRVDFGADDTAMFPLGTHYGTIRLQKDGRWHTVSNTVPVTVSDEVGAVYGGDASAIHLELKFHSGIPDLTGVNDSPANANELARAFKALLDALKSAPRSLGMLALAFCMSAFGASARLSVQSSPLGEVAFSSRVVTCVDFDESGLVTSDEITDVVREGQLKSMSWTNANYVASVQGIVEGAVDGRFFPSTGGTLTGDLAVGEDHTVSRMLTVAAANGASGIKLQGGTSDGIGSSLTIGGSSGSGATLYVNGGAMRGGHVIVGASTGGGGILEVQGSDASIKKGDKEVATESYVDAKVEDAVLPTNPTFSNAVLAVGLNIDTNSVAVLNEIASTFGGFPIEGTATTIGGLLAALAAAVAWLKKNKADKKDADSALGFSTYPIKSVVGNALLDRTVNTSTGGAFTFPEEGDGARDFVVVVAESATAPSVSFPSSGVSYFSDDDAVWTAEADKVNVWYFTEIAANQFMVAHKALDASTQA